MTDYNPYPELDPALCSSWVFVAPRELAHCGNRKPCPRYGHHPVIPQCAATVNVFGLNLVRDFGCWPAMHDVNGCDRGCKVMPWHCMHHAEVRVASGRRRAVRT